MRDVLVGKKESSGLKQALPSDILVSYRPPHGWLTYYYWDDWMLSGLLFPGSWGPSHPSRILSWRSTDRPHSPFLDVLDLRNTNQKKIGNGLSGTLKIYSGCYAKRNAGRHPPLTTASSVFFWRRWLYG